MMDLFVLGSEYCMAMYLFVTILITNMLIPTPLKLKGPVSVQLDYSKAVLVQQVVLDLVKRLRIHSPTSLQDFNVMVITCNAFD